jgi:membrane protease YdiL (CAAX protease family)
MRPFIKSLSPSAEYAIVLLCAFGLFAIGSVHWALHPGKTPPVTERGLQGLLVLEALLLALLGTFLSWRGWTLKRVGLRPGVRDSLVGFALALLAYGLYVAVYVVAANFSELAYSGAHAEIAAHDMRWTTILAASLINPVFEELFLCGYVITRAREAGRLTAGINISVAIRVLCHLYQGSIGVLSIVPFGLLFAFWYARTARLWPLIVAHALFDLLGLFQYLK